MVNINRLFLLKGEDSFLKKKNLNRIKSKYKNNKFDWENVENYFADEDNISNITQVASLFPSQNKFKVSVIRNIDKLPIKKQEEFLWFLENLPSQSVVILITSEDDENNKFIKKIGKVNGLKKIDCNLLKGRRLSQWVKRRVQEKGKKISSSAISLLLERSESNLFNLENELEKLVIYTKKDTIETEEIALLISKNVHYHVFNLIDKACEKKVEEAMGILQQMFIHNIQTPQIVGALGWQLRRMIRGKILIEKEKKTSNEITKILKIPTYFADKYLSQISNFKLADLSKACKELSYIDVQVKQSGISHKLALENFILRLSQ